MKQIIYGCICTLDDPRFIAYDSLTETWTLNDVALNQHFCAVANGGAVAPGAGAYGASSAANFAALATLVANIRLALVANGILS